MVHFALPGVISPNYQGEIKLLLHNEGYHRINVCVIPKFICWNSSPKSIRRRDTVRWLGHEGRVVMSGISPLIKEAPQSSLGPSAMWGYSEQTTISEEVGARHSPNLLALWSWASQSYELWEINVVYKPPSLVFCYNTLIRLRQGQRGVFLGPRRFSGCLLILVLW